MPGISVQTVVLAFAVLLVLIGLAGLAPSILPLLRRRWLVGRLSSMRADGPTPVERDERLGAWPSEEPVAAPTNAAPAVRVPHVMPAPAVAPAAAQPAVAVQEPEIAPVSPVVSTAAAPAEGIEASQPSPEEASEVEVAPSPEGGDDEEEEVDDMLALFREVKVVSSTPQALTEALEVVSAGDLLAQAREVRDMLRRVG
ncbi:MAG TPA: hypothetical protein VNN10_08715 [Dehalococcoidia bacterium]|nr:hypothetical protein [Dehalococcoidia bacterium]